MDADAPKNPAGQEFILVGSIKVYGRLIDSVTRCIHYHDELDIIAIKFPCCDRYYPCHSCHEELSDHKAKVWPKSKFGEKAVICGVCATEHKISQYLEDPEKCSSCVAAFNPRCSLHHHLYFES